MEERKWEDMDADCLANIFGRVELESRVLVIPLVCKPWQKAVRDPLCWQQLIFPPFIYSIRLQTEVIKFVVNKSQGCATSLVLPDGCDREALVYVSEELPALKVLMLPDGVLAYHQDLILRLIVKWKKLESLTLGGLKACINEILELIPIHFPNFSSLRLNILGLGSETASAIVSKVPKLKCLIINEACLQKGKLLLIMQGCKELEYLDVRNCIGFNEDDEEILRLSSGMKNFKCDGSTAYPFHMPDGYPPDSDWDSDSDCDSD